MVQHRVQATNKYERVQYESSTWTIFLYDEWGKNLKRTLIWFHFIKFKVQSLLTTKYECNHSKPASKLCWEKSFLLFILVKKFLGNFIQVFEANKFDALLLGGIKHQTGLKQLWRD